MPEFVTHDFADVPLTANAALVAFTPDGSEITLYGFLPEQRAWTRMFGTAWRHLLAGTGLPVDQELLPTAPSLSRYVGYHRGSLFDAIADPPGEFRVAAKTRAARYPVDRLARRVPYAVWREAPCTVIRAEGDWLRIRLCQPDADQVVRLGAHCVERGVYEAWAPVAEVVDRHDVDRWYEL